MPEFLVDWVLIGLVAGVVGKLIMPGRDPGGVAIAILVGIAGALLSGYATLVAGVALDRGMGRYAAATVGAVALLALYRLVLARRTR